jgi:LDH2 family malate/lactate/ureidoglycolate dehydrogenase
VSIAEAKRFMIDCFCSSNTSKENAEAMAELLVEADHRGHFSHGMNRLGWYLSPPFFLQTIFYANLV